MTPLSGMTGFARVPGQADWGGWVWEAKSVNGRNLDVRIALPAGFESLERAVKAAAQARFDRGSLQISLRIETATTRSGVVIDEVLLAQLIAAAERAQGGGLSSEAIATLMTLKGVVDTGANAFRDLGADPQIVTAIAARVDTVLDELRLSRRAEGAALTRLLMGLLAEMEIVLQSAALHAAEQPRLLQERLRKQLGELDAEGRVDADRVAAELALSAARADVREELDRLSTHFAGARDVLEKGSPAGRQLDFLAQELNREANTLCSKSVGLELTRAGLALKALIDQFKEQAANVE
jgi:uncharacterized protein (TIGR00255 family)